MLKRALAYVVGKLAVKLHYKKWLDIYALCSIHEPELYIRGQRKAKIPSDVKWRVWRRDKFSCHYCGTWGNHLSLDHIVPETYGGTGEIGNLVTACSSCNQKKSATSYEEFINSEWLKKKRQSIRRSSIMKDPTSQTQWIRGVPHSLKSTGANS